MTTFPSAPARLLPDLRPATTVVTLVLVALGAVLWFVILPATATGAVGLVTGLGLGVAALVGSRRAARGRLVPLVAERSPQEVLAQVRAGVITSLVVVEAIAILAFGVSVVMDDRGPFLVAAALALATLWLDATSDAALRRHLARLESAGVSTGLTR